MLLENTKVFDQRIDRLRLVLLVFAAIFQFRYLSPYIGWLDPVTFPAFYLLLALTGFQITSKILTHISNGAPKGDLRKLYVERFVKIIPYLVLWILIAVAFSYLFNSSLAFGNKHVVLKDGVMALGQFYDFAKGYKVNQEDFYYWNVLGTYWHINLEEKFVLVMLAFSAVSSRSKTVGVRGLFLGMGIVFVVILFLRDFSPHSNTYYNIFHPVNNVTHLLVGSLTAFILFYFKKLSSFSVLNAIMLPISLVACISYFFFFPFNTATSNLYWFWILESLLLISLVGLKLNVKRLNFSKFDSVAQYFYVLYLGHVIMIRASEEISFRVIGVRSLDGVVQLENAILMFILFFSLWIMTSIGLISFVKRIIHGKVPISSLHSCISDKTGSK